MTQVVSQKKIKFLKAVSGLTLIWTKQEQPCEPEKKLIISKRYSHSAVYDETDNKPSVFVFGGCTSTSSTYNDLWRLDATTREWYRPVSSGTPPSPKACATLVISRPGELMLFGGWSHPSRYPLHQSWRLFNELHSYDIREMKWTHILPGNLIIEMKPNWFVLTCFCSLASNLKPPTMAGHSATVHNGHMIVFGGLQKQRNNIGQFSSSNDVWSFHLDSETWTHEDIPEPRPKARYGQSQLKLDEDHLLIIGGCGGPNNIYNDVWLLIMKAPHWKWVQCDIKNPEHGSNNMWCHPACKIGDYAVVLGKNLHPKAPQDSTKDSWNFIPQAQRGLNRGHGAIRRPNIHQGNPGPSRPPPALPKSRTPPPEDEDDTEMPSEDDDSGLAIEPVKDGRPSSAKSSPPVFRSSVHLNINASEDSPAGAIGGIRRPMPRMAAFAVGVPSTSNAFNDPSQPPSAKRKQIETRQRQLDSLKRMEERYKNLQKEQNDETGTKAKEPKLGKNFRPFFHKIVLRFPSFRAPMLSLSSYVNVCLGYQSSCVQS